MAAVETKSPVVADVPLPESPTRALTPIQEHGNSDGDVTPKRDASVLGSAPRVLKFHVDSDTVINVKVNDGHLDKFQVSSASIAIASPVWRVMLYGIDAKNRPASDEWSFDVDGDPKAIETLFRIIHFEFAKVPAELTLVELYEVARVTAQYKCTHLVQPWTGKWLSAFSTFAGSPDCYQNAHKALWVAWEFGDAKLFRDMADALVVSSKLNGDGYIVNVSGEPLKDMPMPGGLLEAITKTRAFTISKILAEVEVPIKQLSDKRGSDISYCKVNSDDKKQCEAMMLGSAIPALMSAGLFPVPDHAQYTDSIVTLKDKIESVKTLAYVGHHWKPHKSHDGCTLGLREAVNKCLKEMPVILNDDFYEHLSQQADLSGVDNGKELEDYYKRTPKKVTATDDCDVSIKSESVESGSGELTESIANAEERFEDAASDLGGTD